MEWVEPFLIGEGKGEAKVFIDVKKEGGERFTDALRKAEGDAKG
jgi:hypothetical protein